MDANSNCEAHRAWRRRHQVHLSVVAIASTLLHMLSLLHELARFMDSLHTDCFAGDHAETLFMCCQARARRHGKATRMRKGKDSSKASLALVVA